MIYTLSFVSAVAVGCFVSCVPPILRAIMSKMTPQDKQGFLLFSEIICTKLRKTKYRVSDNFRGYLIFAILQYIPNCKILNT